jgi:hypothetical protein
MAYLYKQVLDWFISGEKSESVLEILIIKIHSDDLESSKELEPHFQSLRRRFQFQKVRFLVWDIVKSIAIPHEADMLLSPKLKRLIQKHGECGSILLIDAQKEQLIDTLSSSMLFSEMNQRIKEYI